MSNLISFISGTIVGAYIAQSYDIVNIKKRSINIFSHIKSLEKSDNENNNR